MISISLLPAYGRSYSCGGHARSDWEAGKDFFVADVRSPYFGRYCSIRDVPKMKEDGIYGLTIRLHAIDAHKGMIYISL